MSVLTRDYVPISRHDGEALATGCLPADEYDTVRLKGETSIGGRVVHYTCEFPLGGTSGDVPALIAPGYMGIEAGYGSLRGDLARRGKPAITFEPARAQKFRRAVHPKYLLHPDALAGRITYGVMQDAEAQYGFDTFDLVAHSMGGIAVSDVARRHPDHVRSALFMASAGLEDHSVFSLSKRLPPFFREELLPNMFDLGLSTNPRAILAMYRYIWRNPYRTCAECLNVCGCDNRDKLADIGNAGVKTAIMNFASDRLICNKTTQDEVGGLVDHCETHPNPSFGHLAPNLSKQSGSVAERIVYILDKINAPATAATGVKVSIPQPRPPTA